MKRFLFLSLAAVAIFAAPASSQAPTTDSALSIALKAPANDSVMTIKPVIEYATVPGLPAAIADSTVSRNPVSAERILGVLGPLSLLMFVGAVKTISADKDAYPATMADRTQLNALIADFYYWTQNRIIAATAATYPVCATGTTTSKVKTTNATVCLNDGVVNAVAATDDAWTLTGGVLAVSSFRKYLLLVSAADAFTVLASDDQATAAACRFPSRPADGITILGVLTVATNASTTFTPGTTLLGAAGITATYIDGSGDVPFLSKQVTP